ncbi:hypothetical protein ACY1J9_001339 [Clostridium botulinum]
MKQHLLINGIFYFLVNLISIIISKKYLLKDRNYDGNDIKLMKKKHKHFIIIETQKDDDSLGKGGFRIRFSFLGLSDFILFYIIIFIISFIPIINIISIIINISLTAIVIIKSKINNS